MASCTVLAHVKRPDGSIVESKLFKDLLHYTADRGLAKEYYAVGTHEDFLRQVKDREDFKTDENGEITFKSLRTITNMNLNDDKLIKALNKDIKEGDYSYTEAFNKIQAFNKKEEFSDRALATMQYVGKGKYHIQVIPVSRTTEEGKKVETNTDERYKLHTLIKNKEIRNRIIELLKQYGVSVSFLENTDEEGGRYSTIDAQRLTNGLWGLISINNYGNTTAVLAEEAGHFAVAALGNHELVQRLEALLQDSKERNKALGKEDAEKANLGTDPAREAAGRLVGKALQRELQGTSVAYKLARRIADWIQRLVKNITGKDLEWIDTKAERIANEIAYGFVHQDPVFQTQNALEIEEERLHDSVSKLAKKMKVLQNKLAAITDSFRAVSPSSDYTELMRDTQIVVSKALTTARRDQVSNPEKVGIAKLLEIYKEILDHEGVINDLINSVNPKTGNPYTHISDRAKHLLMARRFLLQADELLQAVANINALLKEDEKEFVITNLEGEEERVNLTTLLNDSNKYIKELNGSLINKEQLLIADFIKQFYGGEFVTQAVNRTFKDILTRQQPASEEYTFRDWSKAVEESIPSDEGNFIQQFFASASNYPDLIVQIADKATREASRQANIATLHYREQLEILHSRAKKLGLKVSDLFEIGDDGLPTGSIVTAPVEEGSNPPDPRTDAIYNTLMDQLGYVPALRWGQWEKDLEAYENELWAKFKETYPDWRDMDSVEKEAAWKTYSEQLLKNWHASYSLKVKYKDKKGKKRVTYIPDGRIYQSKQWENLKAKYNKTTPEGDHLTRWLKDYMDLKKELDTRLGMSVPFHRLPQFRGTFMDALRASTNSQSGIFGKRKAALNALRLKLLELFAITSDDTDYGEQPTTNIRVAELYSSDEVHKVKRLPVFGVHKLKNPALLATDLFNSTLAYAAMATTNQSMREVANALEVGTAVIRERETNSNSDWLKAGITWAGNAVSKLDTFFPDYNDRLTTYDSLDKKVENGIYQRYKLLLNSRLYGENMTTFKIPFVSKVFDVSKATRSSSQLASFKYLAGNMQGGTVNLHTGLTRDFLEAVAGEHYGITDWLWAMGKYFQYFVPLMMGFGKNRRTDRMSQFLELMDFRGDLGRDIKSWRPLRWKIDRMFWNAMYLPYSAGDHFMQAISTLALAHNTKVISTQFGAKQKKINLWQLYQKEANTDATGTFKAGKRLRATYKVPANSSDITWESLENTVLSVNNRSNADFEEWLLFNYPDFGDETYRKNNIDDFNGKRRYWETLSDKELNDDKLKRFDLLKLMLGKTENYLNSKAAIKAVPTFEDSEMQWLEYKMLPQRERTELANKGIAFELTSAEDVQKAHEVIQEAIYRMLWTTNSESAFSNKVRELNNRLHGIYNQMDKTVVQRYFLGNAIFSMQGWFLGNWEYIYGAGKHNLALDADTEGFMTTFYKLGMDSIFGTGTAAWNIGKTLVGKGNEDTKKGMRAWTLVDMIYTTLFPWLSISRNRLREAGFTDTQYYNMRRVAAQLYQLIVSSWLESLVAPPPEEEEEEETKTDSKNGKNKKKTETAREKRQKQQEKAAKAAPRPAWKQFAYYLIRRNRLEMIALIQPLELFRNGQSINVVTPPAVNIWKEVYDTGDLSVNTPKNPTTKDKEDGKYFYQKNGSGGRFKKGDPKVDNKIKSWIPYYKSIWTLKHGDEAFENYEFGRKMNSR